MDEDDRFEGDGDEERDESAAFYALDEDGRVARAVAKLEPMCARFGAKLISDSDRVELRGVVGADRRRFELATTLEHGKVALTVELDNQVGPLVIERHFEPPGDGWAAFGPDDHEAYVEDDRGAWQKVTARLPAGLGDDLTLWMDVAGVARLDIGGRIAIEPWAFIYEDDFTGEEVDALLSIVPHIAAAFEQRA